MSAQIVVVGSYQNNYHVSIMYSSTLSYAANATWNYVSSVTLDSLYGVFAGISINGIVHNGQIWVMGMSSISSYYPIGYSYDGITWYQCSAATKSLCVSITTLHYANKLFGNFG
jgi:hypothetical protein